MGSKSTLTVSVPGGGRAAWEFLRDFVSLELVSLTPAPVICEGVFDSRVIEFAIEKTHPHIVDHLAVAKFDFNREGSSSALTRLVRGLALLADTDVEAVHHLHPWNLASDVPALSGHIVADGDSLFHDAQTSGNRLKAILQADYGIGHPTLELECHPCDPKPADRGHDHDRDH